MYRMEEMSAQYSYFILIDNFLDRLLLRNKHWDYLRFQVYQVRNMLWFQSSCQFMSFT